MEGVATGELAVARVVGVVVEGVCGWQAAIKEIIKSQKIRTDSDFFIFSHLHRHE